MGLSVFATTDPLTDRHGPALSIFVGMILVGYLGCADAVRSDGVAGALIA
jgi:hypothetical protein